MRSSRVLPPFRHSPKKQSPAALLKLRTSLFSETGQWSGAHSYCTQTHTYVCVYNPVLPWRRRLSQHVGQPLHLTSCLLCCLCIYFSPQLNSLNPMPPPSTPTPFLHAVQSSKPTVTPCQRRRVNTVGLQQGTWEETETGWIKNGVQNDLSLLFFSSPFLLGSLPVSLPAWLVKVSAARQAGLFWQPSSSWLSCPLTREKREGGEDKYSHSQTAQMYSGRSATILINRAHTGKKFVKLSHCLCRAAEKHFTADMMFNMT